MKLVSFVSRNRPGYGLVKDNGVIDLGRRLGERLPTLRALLAAGALSEAERTSCTASLDFPLDGLKLAPVIPDPDKIICIGLNYQIMSQRPDALLPRSPHSLLAFQAVRSAIFSRSSNRPFPMNLTLKASSRS